MNLISALSDWLLWYQGIIVNLIVSGVQCILIVVPRVMMVLSFRQSKYKNNASVKIVHDGCSYCVLIIFIRNHDSHVSSYTLQTIFRMMRYQ